jgi:hypothetical protein
MTEQVGTGTVEAESTVTPAPADVKGNIYASKTELLEWVNGLLSLQLTRLEQVCRTRCWVQQPHQPPAAACTGGAAR